MPLKILVTAKRVEDPESKIKVKPDGAGIVTEGVNYKMNPFDEIAVEEGLRLKEKHGGEVVVASIGTDKSVTEIRAALAMGADRGILVKHDGPLDPVVVSAILAKVVEKEKPDVVLLGKQSIDDDQNQVGQYLAERMGAGQATFASKVDSLESEAEQKKQPGIVLAADGKSLRVVREVDGGLLTLDVSLPAVVTCDLRLNKPRFASLPGIMKAKKKPVEEIAGASLGADLAPKVVVKKLSEPPKRQGGLKVADVAELYAKLKGEAKVLRRTPMSNVLIIAEQSGGHLRKATLHAIAAGQVIAGRTGGTVHVALLGKGIGALATELSGHGVTVHAADSAALEHHLAEAYAPVVAEIAKGVGATFVGAAATAFGKDLVPRVAARLGAATATEVLGFGESGPAVTFHRPMWAGNVLAEVDLATPVKAFTVRPTEFPAAAKGGAGEVKAVAVSVNPAALPARFVEFKEVKSERPELTEARVVVAGGRGTKGDFKELEGLADDLGAALGASRAAVDAGWVPNDWQVGQTGKVVAPELYIAAGISGAIQHLAGMKGSKVIVAINKDSEAPIFQLADYGLVADLFKAVPELREKIKAGKGS